MAGEYNFGAAPATRDELQTMIKERDVARAALAQTMEALRMMRCKVSDSVWASCVTPPNLLADPTGRTAHEEWTKMKAVVEAARVRSTFYSSYGHKFDCTCVDCILNSALAALDVKERP